MNVLELRDANLARGWLLHGLWLGRAAPVTPEDAARALRCAVEVLAGGSPLPPLGFVADIAQVALDEEPREGRQRPEPVAGLAPGLVREYEDYVLGRLYADLSFQRAADALLRYQGRDRDRAMAFLVAQLCRRAGIGGASLSPSLVKRLLDEPADKALAEGWDSLSAGGLDPQLAGAYEEIVAAVRESGDLVAVEDVFELERGTALAEFGQRVALRQVLRAAARMAARLPRRKPRLHPRARQIATRILDEDSYPIGGFASVSQRGSIESLLHSQLSYMEPDDRPDLFDVKFVRDELLYYSRDENQFLRRRQTFVFALWPDLVEARLKEAAMPHQRIVTVLAVLVTAVRQLIDWLSGESLLFEFLFLDADRALEPEKTLVETLVAEQVANGTVRVQRMAEAGLAAHCRQAARRSLCHCLCVSAAGVEPELENVVAAGLVVRGPLPVLLSAEQPIALCDPDDADAWTSLAEGLLRTWVFSNMERCSTRTNSSAPTTSSS